MSAIIFAIAIVMLIVAIVVMVPRLNWLNPIYVDQHTKEVGVGAVIAVISMFVAYAAGRWL